MQPRLYLTEPKSPFHFKGCELDALSTRIEVAAFLGAGCGSYAAGLQGPVGLQQSVVDGAVRRTWLDAGVLRRGSEGSHHVAPILRPAAGLGVTVGGAQGGAEGGGGRRLKGLHRTAVDVGEDLQDVAVR